MAKIAKKAATKKPATKKTQKQSPALEKFTKSLQTQNILTEIDFIIGDVKKSPGSMFTQEDVIELLQEVRTAIKSNGEDNVDLNTQEIVQDLISIVEEGIECQEFIDEIEFALDHREIIVDRIIANTGEIECRMNEAIIAWLDNL